MGAVQGDGQPGGERAAEVPSTDPEVQPPSDVFPAVGGYIYPGPVHSGPVQSGPVQPGPAVGLPTEEPPTPSAPQAPPGGPARDRPTHKWGLGAFALAVATFLAASALIGLLIGATPPSVLEIGFALAVPSLLAAGVALAATKLRGNGPRRDLALGWSWRDVGLGLSFGVGGLFLGLVAATIWVSIVGPDVTSAVAEVFAGRSASVPIALLIALLAIVVAPVCEEILFRGLLWGALERMGAGRWVAFAVTTVLFALFHFEFERTPLLLVISIPIGLARALTGRLLPAIVAHVVNNFLAGVVLFLTLTGSGPLVT